MALGWVVWMLKAVNLPPVSPASRSCRGNGRSLSNGFSLGRISHPGSAVKCMASRRTSLEETHEDEPRDAEELQSNRTTLEILGLTEDARAVASNININPAQAYLASSFPARQSPFYI